MMSDESSSMFGNLVDKYRKAAGLTKRELAERAGLSAGYVNLLLNNQKTSPSARAILALANALRLEPQKREELLSIAGLDPHTITDTIVSANDSDGKIQKYHNQNSSIANIGGIIRVYPALDDTILIERMSQASKILIQDTFFADFRRRLKDVLIARSQKGATIQLLLADPNSPIAQKRSKDISSRNLPSYVPMQVRFTRDDVVRLREEGANIEMRFYDSLPSATQYICDECIFFGILAHGERSDFTPQVEVHGKDSDMYIFLKGEFDTLWAMAKEEDKVDFDRVSTSLGPAT